MLSKLRFKPRNRVSVPMMRCSLGYALHGADEVAKCLAVEGPNECWKMAPSWRVNAPERPEHLNPRTDRAEGPAVHPAPHVVELEEASENADAGLVSSEEIALAEASLHQREEGQPTTETPSGASANGVNGIGEMTVGPEVIQVTRPVAPGVEREPSEASVDTNR